MNEQIFIILAEETEKGVLFDIGATLPLVAIQFLILMFILNILLYNPLLTLVNERNEYVLDNLNKASEMTLEAKELNIKYESELIITKKEAKLEITELQKLQQEKFNNELKISQKNLISDTILTFHFKDELNAIKSIYSKQNQRLKYSNSITKEVLTKNILTYNFKELLNEFGLDSQFDLVQNKIKPFLNWWVFFSIYRNS